ncbi:MAG: arginine--tRNA ligase [Pseudonocardiaceae bacterium]|nr:arginine--tRNA ligase [Pseudonocardiaceae bacterium]
MSGEVRSLSAQVHDAFAAALRQVDLAGADPLVRPSDHADFQSNAAMALAKRAGTKPRDLAERLAAAVREQPGAPAGVELSGPGFLNVSIDDRTVWRQVEQRLAAPRLGIAESRSGERTVIDYSGPNIAKEMHVGHLRTTILGDALARVLDGLGSEVIRQNHLGDWGTQFGMLIQYLDEHPEAVWRPEDLAEGAVATTSALDELYRQARARFEADPGFGDRARDRVVALQSGDETTLARWRELVAQSQRAFQAIYDRLGVLLTPEDSRGESFYNDQLAEVVDELVKAGVAVESDGALCVFSDEFTGPGGDPVPLIVRKRDGGYNYATTDLATIRYRIRDLKASRILYVVDARQAMHFQMIFATARRMGWLTEGIEAVHVPFGAVLGPDGKPFKTRSGGAARLMELLDSAVDRARREIEGRAHDLDAAELERIVADAGIGAVKYADLSTSRTKDYVFDVDRMVSFNGNTGVYLQYAHTRIRSILRKAGDADTEVTADAPLQPAERALVLLLDGMGGTLDEVASSLEPHRLCGYLFALAKAFTDFYESCPVLKAGDERVRGNRLALCRLVGDSLARGLGLLGIAAPERM